MEAIDAVTVSTGSSFGPLQSYWDGYVIYKVNEVWRGVYFYSSVSVPICKNTVSPSDKGLKIQYDNVVKDSGDISKRMLLIGNNGKTTDKFISKKIDKDVKRYNELFFWDDDKIQPTKH
jgi:hypothetical protein